MARAASTATGSDGRSELGRILWTCRGPALTAAVFSLVINLLMLVPPIYMLQMYDRVLASRSEATLVMLTLIVVFLMALMGAMEWSRQRVMIRAGVRLDDRLSDRLFDALFRRALVAGQSGDSQPMQDAHKLRQFFSGSGLFAFLDAPWLPIFLVILFLFHPLIGVVALIGALILVGLAVANHYATRNALAAANREQIAEQRSLDSHLRNGEAAAAMGMTDHLRRRWQERHQASLAQQSRASDLAAPFYAGSRAFRLLLQSLILGTGAYLAIHQVITPGVMIAGSILLTRALAPLDQLIGQWSNVTAVRAAYRRLDRVLAAYPPRQRHMALPAVQGRVAAEQLVVTPPGSRQIVVHGASFTIAAGTCVGLVGPSGAGKSSLLRGLLGVWPAASGSARIDDADVADYNAAELGRQVGYLPQDVELFDGTVAENIARFDADATDDAVIAAARAAGVHELVLHLAEGYDTQLGPGGATLSVGQRQRLGLARALYGDPAVLALDEPNANLDEDGERCLQRAVLAGRERGRTHLIVSHRQAMRSTFDRMLVVKDGRIALDGPAGQVMEKLQAGQSAAKRAASAPAE